MAILHQLVVALVLVLASCTAESLYFNFPKFSPNVNNLTLQGDAFVSSSNVIQLTRNQLDDDLTSSVGRASFDKPVRLWDTSTRRLTDFTTHFTFVMKSLDPNSHGDGISFFIAPFDSDIPVNSSGGYLALFRPETASNTSANRIVAVEFDSFQNDWDPNTDHVGINVNSIESISTRLWKTSIKTGSTANAWIWYNATTFNLSVFLTYADNPKFNGNSSLSHIIDFRTIMPETVRIGFSASTGSLVEIHNILSWSFASTLQDPEKDRVSLAVTLSVGFSLVAVVAGISWFILRRRKPKLEKDTVVFQESFEDDFEKGTGPKKFTYRDLSRATNNFSEEGKLGEGGFGGVYKGLLNESNVEVAVKRVSRGSKQGRKEYVSEVRIISRLRHRNLVQLLGWCHEGGELLLVYEYLPNGSLDSHLFGEKRLLIWTIRYKIALGVASALLYLHEEWEQCVVHRDIKASNVMLDSNFNAKLGDFGLARLVDHNLGSQTTVLAGTMGYLAPECVTTGKASKESDVYSFGMVALEIACGRRPVEPRAELSKVRLVEWVWGLYGRGRLSEAADKRLCMEYDEGQMEYLLTVGLWCSHPDYSLRPTIRQAISVLNYEAPLPMLPSKLPVPVYYAPPMEACRFSYHTSFGLGDTDETLPPNSSGSTQFSKSGGSGRALLSPSNTE
ncbi:hypothetical protein MLD38_008087 [Melastoma candidum]|uniref:Uncharacterized protein n=1 Tax=Melastoma candidum TaxID=119954 RepID=A0ACB9RSC3_9MYRT|nr:hypothetical protein MLD38_008087 [Melastoma candidum]